SLSDQIPSERAHEIWSRVTSPPWQGQMNTFSRTVERKLIALETITRRLEEDLRPVLGQNAAPINIAPPARQTRVSTDGQLWFGFARLNEVIAQLEIQQIRAMPPHEREARFRSARLVRRLSGRQERETLTQLGLSGGAGRRVYELRADSREVRFREGDFK